MKFVGSIFFNSSLPLWGSGVDTDGGFLRKTLYSSVTSLQSAIRICCYTQSFCFWLNCSPIDISGPKRIDFPAKIARVSYPHKQAWPLCQSRSSDRGLVFKSRKVYDKLSPLWRDYNWGKFKFVSLFNWIFCQQLSMNYHFIIISWNVTKIIFHY